MPALQTNGNKRGSCKYFISGKERPIVIPLSLKVRFISPVSEKIMSF